MDNTLARETSSRTSVSVILPCRNESKDLAGKVAALEQALVRHADEYELILINDGSTDDTGLAADGLAMNNERVRVVHHCLPEGYDAAVWSGIQAARMDRVAFAGKSHEFEPASLERLLEESRHSAVLGYKSELSWSERINVAVLAWNALNRILFGLRVRDVESPYKLLDRKMAAGLPVLSRGGMMSVEMLARIQKLGIDFHEVPVTAAFRKASRPLADTWNGALIVLKEMMALYWGDLGSVTQKQALRFGTVGIINTSVDLILYLVLTRFVPIFAPRLVLAKALSFMAATVSSLFLNHSWTFKIKGGVTLAEALKFYSTAGFGLLVNALSMYVFTGILGLHDIAAALLSTVFSFMWNFTASRLWVFAHEPKKFPLPKALRFRSRLAS